MEHRFVCKKSLLLNRSKDRGEDHLASQTERSVVSIAELTRRIKSRIESDPFLQQCWVRGEISNFTRHSSGHLYFTIKDDQSKIKAVMFKGSARFLSFIPKDGMKVLARGSVSVFERDGSYQLYVEELQPDGLGSLHLAFEQMKTRLEAEGLFAADRKRTLPRFPKVIGVITSPTGAAVRDIITTIKRRYPVAHVLLYPVLVQGTGSAASIALAIQKMNALQEADVLIVGRGGGSLEELWAFNEEVVARAIFQSQVPVISAVGHETDFTIADFVADVRAATPTAAAELAVPVFSELSRKIMEWESRMVRRMNVRIVDAKRQVQQLVTRRSFTHPLHVVDRKRELLDHASRSLENALVKRSSAASSRVQEWMLRLSAQSPKKRVENLRQKLDYFLTRAEAAVSRDYAKNQNQLNHLLLGLEAYSPLGAMRRGYALVYQPKSNETAKQKFSSQLVRSVTDVNLGDVVSIRVQDGWLECQVWGLKEELVDERSKDEREGGHAKTSK